MLALIWPACAKTYVSNISTHSIFTYEKLKATIMKNYILGVLTSLIVVIIVGFVGKEKSTIPKKEWIVGPRFLTLQKGISKEQAREWMEKEYLPLYRYYSGWNAELGEPTSSGKC